MNNDNWLSHARKILELNSIKRLSQIYVYISSSDCFSLIEAFFSSVIIAICCQILRDAPFNCELKETDILISPLGHKQS